MLKIDLGAGVLSPSSALLTKGGIRFRRRISQSVTALDTPPVAITNVSVSSLTVTCQAVANATSYVFQRAASPAFDQDLVTLQSGASLTYNDSLLLPNKQYYYRVRATNSLGQYSPSLYGQANATTIRSIKGTRNSYWRFSTPADRADYPWIREGDVVVPGSINDTGGLYIPNGQGPTLGAGKRIWVRGGSYIGTTQIDLTKCIGTPEDPVIVTTYGGCPVIARDGIAIVGGDHIRFTGKYDPVLQIGQAHLRGHDANYAWRHYSYGFICDFEWVNKDAGGFAVFGVNNLEIDYVEARNGGFAPFHINSDYPSNIPFHNFRIHDNLVYCCHGEGTYAGNTKDVSNIHRRITGLRYYNNTICYSGNDGLQFVQMSDDNIIENNVVVGAGSNWRNTFDVNQDNGMSLGFLKGGTKVRKNIVFSSGDKHMQIFYSGPTPAISNGDTVDVEDNVLFGATGALGIYLGQNWAQVYNAPINIKRNYFGRHVFKFDQVYKGAKATALADIIRHAIGHNLLTLEGNRFDGQGGKTRFLEHIPASNTAALYTQVNNVQTDLPDVKFQGLIAPLFKYHLAEMWTARIGDTWSVQYMDQYYKGEIVYYPAGQYITHHSHWYRAKQVAGNIEPEVHPQWTDYWSKVYWHKETLAMVEDPADRTEYSPLPPLDARLVADNSIYLTTGIGLKDNPLP